MYKIISLIAIVILSIGNVSACSSVYSVDSFGFQRDSVEPANVSIQNISGNLIESKPGFVHSIIFANGDIVSKGGSDSKISNFVISNIAILANKYDPRLIYLAAPFVWYSGGHLCYKYDDRVIIQCYNDGIYVKDVALSKDDYIVVSNSAKFINSYRVNDSKSAIDSHKFAPVEHHRYFIDYSHGISIYDALDKIEVR